MRFFWLGVCVAAASLWTAHARSDERDKAPAPAEDAMRGKAPGEVRDDNGLKMKFIWCPPGFLTMENVEPITGPSARTVDDPFPTRIATVKVLLTQGYWLGKYEVTQSEWKAVMQTEPWQG